MDTDNCELSSSNAYDDVLKINTKLIAENESLKAKLKQCEERLKATSNVRSVQVNTDPCDDASVKIVELEARIQQLTCELESKCKPVRSVEVNTEFNENIDQTKLAQLELENEMAKSQLENLEQKNESLVKEIEDANSRAEEAEFQHALIIQMNATMCENHKAKCDRVISLQEQLDAKSSESKEQISFTNSLKEKLQAHIETIRILSQYDHKVNQMQFKCINYAMCKTKVQHCESCGCIICQNFCQYCELETEKCTFCLYVYNTKHVLK